MFYNEIKDALNEFNSVLYIDTSIRFFSNEILPLFDSKLKDIGIITRYIQTRLPCVTDHRMFEWYVLVLLV